MDNNLITLGKRENAVFILTPLYLVLFYFFRQFYLTDESGLDMILRIPYMIGFLVAIVATLRFFRRIVLPSKILEYDAMHLYINRGIKGTQVIPWTDVRSVDNLQTGSNIGGFVDARFKIFRYSRMQALFSAAWKLSEIGVIVINCKDELIRVHGIRNAREVRNKLHEIIFLKRENIENSLRVR